MQYRIHPARRRLAPWLIAILAVAGLAAFSGVAAECEDAAGYARVEIAISYEMVGEKRVVKAVNVKPDEAKIYKTGSPNKVCWVIPNLGSGLSLEISGKDVDGNPKPFGDAPIVAAGGEAESGEPTVTGRWRYNVTIKGGPKPFIKDPIIVIDPGDGGSVQPGGGD